jgi:hypothetical protein
MVPSSGVTTDGTFLLGLRPSELAASFVSTEKRRKADAATDPQLSLVPSVLFKADAVRTLGRGQV